MATNVAEHYPFPGHRADSLLSMGYGHVVDRYAVEHRPSVYDLAPTAAPDALTGRAASSIFFDLAPASVPAPVLEAPAGSAGANIIDDMLSVAGQHSNSEEGGQPQPPSGMQQLQPGSALQAPAASSGTGPVQAGSTRPAVLMPRVWRLMGEDEAGTPQCRKCRTRFEKRGNLQRHVLHVHFKHKPFQCLACRVAFGYKSHLLRHLGTVHRKDRDDQPHMGTVHREGGEPPSDE